MIILAILFFIQLQYIHREYCFYQLESLIEDWLMKKVSE